MSTERDRKLGRYRRIREQLDVELGKSDDPFARMATVAALLHHRQPHFFWTGFYRHVGDELVVGPYQGSLACQAIPIGQGVCGTAFARGKTLIVPDVHGFEGHIACDARSRSEIVVPYRDPHGNPAGVLDVDSTDLAAFDDIDAKQLEIIVEMLFSSPSRS